MKNYFIYYVLFFAFISCDSAESLTDRSVSTTVSMDLQHRGEVLPFNPQNPYDSIGVFHNDLVASYYAHEVVPTDLDRIIAMIEADALDHPFFLRLAPSGGPFVLSTEVSDVLTDPEPALSGYVGGSVLGSAAQACLHHFVDSVRLFAVTDANYAAFYKYVVDYEAFVISHFLFSQEEKRVLLQITSIARHNAYQKRKRPKKNTDLDWDWLTTCVVGSTAGAYGGEAKGVLTAVVVGVLCFEP